MSPTSDKAIHLAEHAREAMEAAGHNGFVPMTVVEFENKIVPVGMQGVPAGHLKEAVKQTIQMVQYHLGDVGAEGPIIAVAVHDDSYVQMAQPGQEMPVAGELGKRFAEGDPTVSEQLGTIYLTKDARVFLTQLYRYTPVDGWEWEEVNVMMDTTDPTNTGSVDEWTWEEVVG